MSTLRLAAVQSSAPFLDLDGSVERACDLIREAGAGGARIVGFPEGFIPGHPYWFHFVPAAGGAARKYAVRLWENALEVPGPHLAALCQAAKDVGAYVVMGCCERSPSTGTLYNSQLFIDAGGALVAKHQKLVPTHAERVVHTPGLRAHAVATMGTEWGWPVGGLICGEHFNPLARFALMAAQERVHVASWPANFSATGHRQMYEAKNFAARAHAHEAGAFVINAAGVLSDAMIEQLSAGGVGTDAVGSRGGGSSIVSPKGDYIAGPLDAEETILYGDADLGLVLPARLMHDVTGHYQRADVFQLTINRDDPSLVRSSGPVAAALARHELGEGREESPDGREVGRG